MSRRCIWQNYGHIDENGQFVRKWLALKMAITDKMVKNGRLSVKCVLLTDKSAKNGILSVKLSEILVEQHYFLKDVFLRAKMDVVFNRGLHFTGRSQKSPFCPYFRLGALIERAMRSTAFCKKSFMHQN